MQCAILRAVTIWNQHSVVCMKHSQKQRKQSHHSLARRPLPALSGRRSIMKCAVSVMVDGDTRIPVRIAFEIPSCSGCEREGEKQLLGRAEEQTKFIVDTFRGAEDGGKMLILRL